MYVLSILKLCPADRYRSFSSFFLFAFMDYLKIGNLKTSNPFFFLSFDMVISDGSVIRLGRDTFFDDVTEFAELKSFILVLVVRLLVALYYEKFRMYAGTSFKSAFKLRSLLSILFCLATFYSSICSMKTKRGEMY